MYSADHYQNSNLLITLTQVLNISLTLKIIWSSTTNFPQNNKKIEKSSQVSEIMTEITIDKSRAHIVNE